ncbi:MAG: hypothetical protein IJJ90_01340 [Prevotella sp.]|nr:hypothetical protein [Prevotella sp.]
MNDSTKPHCSNYQAEKQQVANKKGKQLVLVSNLVLIALQFGPYCKPKQVVLLESLFRLGCTEPCFGVLGTLFWGAGNKLWATGNKLYSM